MSDTNPMDRAMRISQVVAALQHIRLRCGDLPCVVPGAKAGTIAAVTEVGGPNPPSMPPSDLQRAGFIVALIFGGTGINLREAGEYRSDGA